MKRVRLTPALTAAVLTGGLAAGGATVALTSADADTAPAPGATSATTTTSGKPLAPTKITLPKTTIGDGSATVRVKLSGKPAAGAPLPSLKPAAPGTWTRTGRAEVFRPASTLSPCTKYALTVPAGTQASGAAATRHARKATLAVSCPGAKAAQLALARLHYLPYTALGTRVVGKGRAAAAHAAFRPTATLRHSLSGAPTVQSGTLDTITKSALMGFQSDHGLTVDGSLGASTWSALISAEAAGHRRADPYTWVVVTKGSPELATLHRGSETYATPANTGVAGAETADGTFAVFERFAVTTMSGTNPDGSTYVDPGIKWVSYFNGGDALHAFPRGSYGSPQSNGCVEMQDAPAEKIWRSMHIGDVVIVRG